MRDRLRDLLEPVPDDEVMPVDFSRRRVRISRRAATAISIAAVVLVFAVVVGMVMSRGPSVEMPDVEPAGVGVESTRGGSAGTGGDGANSMNGAGVSNAGQGPGGRGSAIGAADGAGGVPGAEEAVPEFIVVSVVGLVHRPGVVRVAGTARVSDAIDAAGGILPEGNPASVNLAAPLRDGEQVLVGAEAVPQVSSGGTGSDAATGGTGSGGVGGAASDGAGAGGAGGLVNINTATEAELETVTGIGPATAKKIVAHRERNGPFTSVDQLEEVPGIGPAKLEGMRSEVTV